MQAFALTDVGKSRNTNQDYIFSSPQPIGPLKNLFIVADGMGGHQAGDYASKSVVEELVSFVESSPNDAMVIPTIRSGIQRANRKIYYESLLNSSLTGMGSTLVAATLEDSTLYVANVGDSRLYLIRSGINQITKDHSYVEELVSLGQMERGSEDYLSKKNIITRAIGTQDNIEIDFFETPIKSGDILLLCSDGLTNMLPDDDIAEVVLSSNSLQSRGEQLVAMANANGGRDNIAVILVEPQISEVSEC